MSFYNKFLMTLFLILTLYFFIPHMVFADELPIYSPTAILIDAQSGNVLYEKNSNMPMFPASTTKVLTAILALENCSLEEKITASPEAIHAIKSGYTNANIQANETLSMEDLLYALLLSSANEAANVIAERVGGTIENFANIMNEKAMQIGCTNTHFVNANGIHDDNHYTTASDLAKITQYCMQNETFRKIVSTLEYTLPATEQYPATDRVLKNTNSLMLADHQFYYPYAIGIKTGFTTQAKNCLIAASHKDGLELISVVLHAEATEDGRSARYLDTIQLLEYGNTHFQAYSILEKGEKIDTITVSNASKNTKKLDIIAKDSIKITLPITETPDISSTDISVNSNITAPIEKGSVVGTASYIVNGETYSSELVAASDVSIISVENEPESSTISFMPLFYVILLLIIIRLLIFYFRKQVHKNRKKAKRYLNP